MRFYSVMFESATVPLSLPSLRTGRGAAVSFAAGGSFTRSGRYVARFIEIVVFAMLLALIAFPAPARAQTFTMSSVAAAPAAVQPGKTVVFTDTITANQNASNYNFAFLLSAPGGSNVAQQFFTITAKAGVPLTEAYGWTVPAGAKPGTYTMETAVFNPAWSQILVSKTIALTVTAATAVSATTYPTLLEAPVISGTAQVGNVLTSTTGTWSGATSFAYQWSGNKTWIAGATAATYTPVANDVGHTLTSTVVATGSPGALSSFTSAATVPIVAASSGSPPVTVSGSVPFVALHTYYMSPTGSDSNNGTSAASAWATPNHALNCGDVIVAAAGSYAPKTTWGAVSNCPSTSGGIDGAGGVYFATLLCGGAVGACSIVGTVTGTAGMEVNANNWAVEGWAVSEGYTCSGGPGYGFMVNTSVSGAVKHHVAFINDIAYHNGSGFGTNGHGTNGGGGYGADYFAIVGDIAQDSAGRCDGGLSTGAVVLIGMLNYNTAAGTHTFVAGNFSYNNQQTLGATDKSDGECYLMDTLDYPTPGYGEQIVFRDNISAVCERFGLQLFYQGYSANTPTIKVYNNTFVAGNQMNYSTGSGSNQGDINVQGHGGSDPDPWIIPMTNNIVRETKAVAGGGENVFAMMNGGSTTTTAGGAGTQNVLYGLSTAACQSACDTGNPTKSIIAYAPSTIGTNYYVDAAFHNLTDALTNQIGKPNCSNFSSTASCEGENFGGNPTNPSLTYDLAPTAAQASGKGFRLPASCVASDPDYPIWLKGVVFLQWNGSTLSENSGLITKPCNM
jgi:hypothetical protein